MLDVSIATAKLNAAAGLSARSTMAIIPFAYACIILEAAAKNEVQHEMLLQAGVMDALEYACANDFSLTSISIAAFGAGGAVALVGRNEGGKTLSRGAVASVAGSVERYFRAD